MSRPRKFEKGCKTLGLYSPRRVHNFLSKLTKEGVFESPSEAGAYCLRKIVDGEVDIKAPDGRSLYEIVHGRKPSLRIRDSVGSGRQQDSAVEEKKTDLYVKYDEKKEPDL